jgi:hypothetical protein
VTANDVIAFVHKAPIPKKARDLIIAEMESYVAASLSTNALSLEEANSAAERDGNRKGGARKFFTHFLHWGAFAVSGSGGNVHHPNLTEDQDDDAAVFEAHDGDEELNNIVFEASVLRMEGKIEEAVLLEKRIRQLRLDNLKNRVNKVKATGFKAGRGFLDIMDYLDKKLLDQDSDEVSVSDEEEHADIKGEKDDSDASKSDTELHKAIDGADGTDDLAKNSSWLQPHDMDYGKWKGRVSSLNMNVALPSMLTADKKKEKLVALRNKMLSPSPNKADNYEYNMRKKHNTKNDKDDEEENPSDDDDDDNDADVDDDDDDEDDDENGDDDDDEDFDGLSPQEIRHLKALREKEREKKLKKQAVKDIRRGVRSYAEIAKSLSNQVAKKARDLPFDKIKLDMHPDDNDVQKEKDNCVIM